jgi:hypothetical protein
MVTAKSRRYYFTGDGGATGRGAASPRAPALEHGEFARGRSRV